MLFWPQEKWCTRTYEEARLALTHLQAASPLHWLHRPLSLSVCLTHSHTQTKTGLQRGQSLISQSFSLRRSQTSLRCSKNKIPAVKLSALRFCAFNAEANQKFEKKKKKRDVRHTHPGKVNTFKTMLEMSGCSEFVRRCARTKEKINWKCKSEEQCILVLQEILPATHEGELFAC